MILTNIHAQVDERQYPKAVNRALEFLRSHDFMEMEPGEYPIDGKKMYAKVFDVRSKPVEETDPEIHLQYIDVQFWPCGEERMGYAPRAAQVHVIREDAENDLYFIDGVQGEKFIPAAPGDVMVLFPEDAHRPAVQKDGPLDYRKVVVKISMELL